MAKMRGVPPRRKDEREYYEELSREYLNPFISGLAKELSKNGENSSTSQWLAIVAGYTAKWIKIHETRFPKGIVEKWANRVNSYHADRFVRNFWRNARVDLRKTISSVGGDVFEKAIKENIGLIKTIPERFHDELSRRYILGERASPMDLKERAKIFRQVGKSSGYNLRRITRDQSNKLTGKLSEIRQTEVGIKQYRWETSIDDRVRETHQEKHGIVFSWDNPPMDTGHPGHDIQCRCVAIPEISADEIRRRFGG